MPSLPVPYGGAFIIVSLFDGVLPFHVPLWRGPGGGFGLLGEQSLQQPPPAFHATSASGGHMEGSPVGLPPYLSPFWRGPHFFVPLMEGVQGEDVLM